MSDASNPPRSDLAIRAATGAGLIALAALALWSGGILFWLVAVIAGVLMMAEWCDLERVPAPTKRIAQFSLSVPLAITCPWAAGPNFFALGLVAGAAFFTAIATRRSALGIGTFYVGLPVFSIMLLREQPGGLLLAFWTLALVWACDIGAYFTGRAIGGPRLAPAISPNKTWAGLAGGVVAAAVFGAVLHQAAGLPRWLALWTPILAVLSQGGDLYESWLKRRAGVKDSGRLLPGHGGFLDRLDGLVPVAPAAALLVELPRLLG